MRDLCLYIIQIKMDYFHVIYLNCMCEKHKTTHDRSPSGSSLHQ